MSIRIAINGFGRIGRAVLRSLHTRGLLGTRVHVVAITDLSDDAAQYAYQLKYDSVHRRFNAPVETAGSGDREGKKDILRLGDTPIRVFRGAEDPGQLPWKSLGIDCVVETTGRFTTSRQAGRHLDAGAERVILSHAPGDKGIKTIIIGVNEKDYDPRTDAIVSNGNCTANCVAPLVQSLLGAGIGIDRGHLTVLLPHTASRKIVDSFSSRGWRDGRSAAVNIIPSSIGVSRIVGELFPQLRGRIDDVVFRVPVAEVSLVEFSFMAAQDTTLARIDAALRESAATGLKGILGITDDEVVSSDIIDDSSSSVYDAPLTLGSNIPGERRFFRIFAWYDNEWGHAGRIVDMLAIMESASVHLLDL